MPLFARWRTERDFRRRTDSYVAALLAEPASSDVEWLADAATRGDTDHATWELRYARRAIGLVVAEREALDDRTGSSVGRAFAEAFERDPHVARDRLSVARQQFNIRLAAYRDVLTSRPAAARSRAGTPAVAQTSTRLGQILLVFAGGPVGAAAEVGRAGEIVAGYLDAAHAALRQAFGDASLPEDVAPSAVRRS